MSNNPHRMITIYGDTENQDIGKAIWPHLPSSDFKILSPSAPETFAQAARNSVLIFVGFSGDHQGILSAIEPLRQKGDLVADIGAILMPEFAGSYISVLGQGVDFSIPFSDIANPDFKTVLFNKLKSGNMRMNSLLQEEEQKRLVDALSASAQAMIVFDHDKRIVFATEHHYNAYPKNAALLQKGVNVYDAFEAMSREDGVFEDHPDYERLKNFWFSLNGKEDFQLPNGKTYRTQATPLPEGRGTVVTTTSITDKINNELQLQKKSLELEDELHKERQSSSVQKQFIDMVSHEFKTPMTIIDGNAQIIQKRINELEKDQIIRRAKTIQSAVKRLTSMIDGILSSSMLESGKMAINPTKFNLRTVLKSLIVDHTSFSENIKLKYNLDALPDTVFLDAKLMTLILTNLLSNAVKYAGEIPEIEVKTQSDDLSFSISVLDNGIGIPEGELESVFEKYYRGKNTSGVSGTGIGLSLSKELVEKQSGILTVKNNETGGTCFTLTFPIHYNEERRRGFL